MASLEIHRYVENTKTQKHKKYKNTENTKTQKHKHKNTKTPFSLVLRIAVASLEIHRYVKKYKKLRKNTQTHPPYSLVLATVVASLEIQRYVEYTKTQKTLKRQKHTNNKNTKRQIHLSP